MEENNRRKIIEESELNKVTGGIYIRDIEKSADDIAEVLRGVGAIFSGLGELLQLLQTSMETNTCPVCKQKIVPLAEQCDLLELINHIKVAHQNNQ